MCPSTLTIRTESSTELLNKLIMGKLLMNTLFKNEDVFLRTGFSKMLRTRREEGTGDCRELPNEELHDV